MIKLNTEPVRFAFPTDIHAPHHDPKALDCALRIIEDYDPHVMSAGSDALDFYSISRFDRDPHRMVLENLDVEIDTWKEVQHQLNDAAPNATKLFLVGNHEQRLLKYQKKHPEIFGLRALKLENLLDFETFGIDFAPNNEIQFGNQLVVKHGDVVRKYSGYSAKGELEKERYSISTMSGHTHRGGTHYATTRDGVIAAYECFCLCDLNPEYVTRPNWQQGIALATLTREWLEVDMIPFYNKGAQVKAVWRGKEYSS